MLVRRPRIGTVVTGRSPEHSLRFFVRYFRLHGIDGSLQTSRAVTNLLREAPAGEGDAARLGVQPGTPLIHIHRLRLIAKRPVVADAYRFPASRVPGFPRDPAELPQLLGLHLLERWGIRVSAVREELRADLAGTEELRLLKLVPPAALLAIEATFFDQAGQPFLIATQHAWTDTQRYVNEVR